jgi:hypothetical protein
VSESQQPRRVLDKESHDSAYAQVQATAERTGTALPIAVAEEMVDVVLYAAGILPPPPEPDPSTCTAQCPDEDGYWWQCTDEPGHDPSTGHDSDGDWWWSADHPDAIAPRVESGQ